MKHKIYFNGVAGNNNDGYMIKYIEGDKEWNFTLSPQIYSNSEGISNIKLHRLSNSVPFRPMINTAYTPSAFFEFTEDESFFDPMSILWLAKSYQGRSNIYYNVTNKALAFPMRYNDMVLTNHYLNGMYSSSYRAPTPYYIGYYGEQSYWGDLSRINASSVTEESLKKEVFNYGLSMNIEAIEKQTGLSWDSIVDQSYDVEKNETLKYYYLIGVRYPISSDHNIDFDRKISLSHERGNSLSQAGSRGLVFTQHMTSTSNTGYNSNLVTEYLVDGYTLKRKSDNWYLYNQGGKYTPPTSGSYNTNPYMDQDLPSAIFLQDEVFNVKSNLTNGNFYLIPVYNEHNEDEFYFTPIYIGSDYTSLPPSKESLYLSQLGVIRLVKNKELNKWILNFSSDTVAISYNYNPKIGHFECDGDRDPWANPNDSDFSEKGLVMRYIDGNGNPGNDADMLSIYPFKYYNSSYRGTFIPGLLGDIRYYYSYWQAMTGTNIRPRYALYRDDYQAKTYVCTESGAYTIPI